MKKKKKYRFATFGPAYWLLTAFGTCLFLAIAIFLLRGFPLYMRILMGLAGLAFLGFCVRLPFAEDSQMVEEMLDNWPGT